MKKEVFFFKSLFTPINNNLKIPYFILLFLFIKLKKVF